MQNEFAIKSRKSSFQFVGILVVIAILLKILGFVKNVVFSYYFGANPLTDAYNIALTTPETFLNIISQATTIAFIPIYISLLNKKGKQESDIFVSKFLLISFVFTTFCMFLLELLPNVFVRIFASNFSESELSQAAFFLRISSIALSLQGILTVLISYAQANKKYIVPALITLPLDLVYVVLVVLAYYLDNFNLLLFITIIAVILQILMFLPLLIKDKFKFKFSRPFFDENIKSLLIACVPIFISTVIIQLNNVIGRNFASKIDGAITNMAYAYLLTSVFEQILVASVAVVLYSDLSEASSQDDIDRHKSSLSLTLKLIGIVIVPVCLGLFVFSKEIVYLIYGRGEMTNESIVMISDSLKGYSINLFFVVLSIIMIRALYSQNLKWLTIIVSSIGVSLNLGFTALFWFVLKIGVLGIALGASIGNAFIAVFYLIYYLKKNKPFIIEGLFLYLVKIAISLILSFVCGYLLQLFVFGKYLPQYGIIFTTAVIIIMYFGLLLILKLKEFTELFFLFKKRSN